MVDSLSFLGKLGILPFFHPSIHPFRYFSDDLKRKIDISLAAVPVARLESQPDSFDKEGKHIEREFEKSLAE